MNASVNAFNILDLIAVSGAEGPSTPSRGVVSIGTGQPDRFYLSCEVRLLHLVGASALIDLRDSGITVDVCFNSTLLDMVFNLESVGPLHNPSDFTLYADVEQHVLDWLGTDVANHLEEAKDALDAHLDNVLAKLDAWEQKEKPKIDEKKAKIQVIKAADIAVLDELEAKLYNAKQDLQRAKSKVDSLQNEINSEEQAREHCKFWNIGCHARNAARDIKIAALWVAKHVADAALDIAEGVVHLAQEAVKEAEKIEPNVDPRILALETEIAAIEAAGKAAEAAVKAAKAIIDGVGDFLHWTLVELGTALNLESLSIKAESLSGVNKGGELELKAAGIFFGKHRSWDLTLPFPPSIENIAAAIWTDIKNLMHI
jgi:hypothetical protein